MTKEGKQGKPGYANPRNGAFAVLYRVATDGAYANLTLNAELAKNHYRREDANLVTALVYGVLRQQRRLDYALTAFVNRPLEKLPLKILLILRLGAYQLLEMEKIPPSAAVNESVKLARKHGHAGTVKLVNGVLRRLSAQKDNIQWPDLASDLVTAIAVAESHPDFLVQRWLEELGPEETYALCHANNQPAPFTVRVNTLKADKQQVAEALAAEGILAHPGNYAPDALVLQGCSALGKMKCFRQGLLQVQDESSQLAALSLSPSPGSHVIDLCAAPGGKTTYLAQLMANQGKIKAFDLYPHKVKLIEENCQRLGISIVETAVADATLYQPELKDWADYLLLDAPCSGLGVLGRRPDARWQKTPVTIEEMAALSKQILEQAACYVKPGGWLLYSTCTITPEENEQNIEWFLQRHESFILRPLTAIPAEWQQRQGMCTIYPHRQGIDGFFMALLQRRGSTC